MNMKINKLHSIDICDKWVHEKKQLICIQISKCMLSQRNDGMKPNKF